MTINDLIDKNPNVWYNQLYFWTRRHWLRLLGRDRYSPWGLLKPNETTSYFSDDDGKFRTETWRQRADRIANIQVTNTCLWLRTIIVILPIVLLVYGGLLFGPILAIAIPFMISYGNFGFVYPLLGFINVVAAISLLVALGRTSLGTRLLEIYQNWADRPPSSKTGFISMLKGCIKARHEQVCQIFVIKETQ